MECDYVPLAGEPEVPGADHQDQRHDIRFGILSAMSTQRIPAHTKDDGTQVSEHVRRSGRPPSSAAGAADAQARHASLVAAQDEPPVGNEAIAASRLASKGLAEELGDFKGVEGKWGEACGEYLKHQELLEGTPGIHESVIHFRLRRMEDALEVMYENDGATRRLPYEFYAEGIAHVQEEVEHAEYALASAADPQVDDIPEGMPGLVPYGDFTLGDEDEFFSKSTEFLGDYNGDGVESSAWQAARKTYLSCQQVYESEDTHDAHALFCVRRGIHAFGIMEKEALQRATDEDATEFYAVGQQRLNRLVEAAEYASASAPIVSEADRRAQAHAAQQNG